MLNIKDNKIETGKGCAGRFVVALFGTPFFAAGSFVIYQSFTAKGTIDMILGMLFGAVFALVGLSLITMRGGMKIDKNTGEMINSWGFLIFSGKKQSRISDVSVVSIVTERRRSKNSSYTVYVLKFTDIDFKVSENREYIETRRESEQLARFLNISVKDTTKDPVEIRTPDKLDETVAQRSVRENEIIEIPAEPQERKSEVLYSEDGRSIKIHIPGFKGFFDQQIFLEPDHIRMVSKILFSSNEKIIPFSELEEFNYKTRDSFDLSSVLNAAGAASSAQPLVLFSNTIQACSDNELIQFGNGLSSEEILWLYWNIKKFIVENEKKRMNSFSSL